MLASDDVLALAREGGADALERLKEAVNDACVAPHLKLNTADPDTGRTALHYAALRGDEHMAQLLAKQRGINLNCLDHQGYTPLALALLSRSLPTIIRLLSTAFTNTHCSPIDLALCRPDAPERSAMGVAIAADSPDQLDCLLSLIALYESRAAPRRRSGMLQRSPSMTSMPSSSSLVAPSSMRGMMLHQAVDSTGRSPLAVALQQQKLAHALVLLEAGASLATEAATGAGAAPAATRPASPAAGSPPLGSPFSTAFSASSPHVTAMLRTSSSKHDSGGLPQGSTTLHMAIWCVLHIKAAVERPSSLSTSTSAGGGAAGADGSAGSPVAEQLLLANRLLSQMLDHPELAQVAVQQDERGECSLHAAVRAGLVLVVEKLATRVPACMAVLNHAGMSALEVARGEGGSRACAEMLQTLQSGAGAGLAPLASGSWRVGSLLRSVSRSGSFKMQGAAMSSLHSLPGRRPAGDGSASSRAQAKGGAHGVVVLVAGSAAQQALAEPISSNASSTALSTQQEKRRLLKNSAKPAQHQATTPVPSHDNWAASCLSFAALRGRRQLSSSNPP